MSIRVVSDFKSINVYRSTTANVNEYVFSTTPAQTIEIERWDGATPVFRSSVDGGANWSAYSTAPAINMNPDLSIDDQSVPDPFSPLSPYHPLLFVVEYEKVRDASSQAVEIRAQTNSGFLIEGTKSSSGTPVGTATLKQSGNPMSNFIMTYAQGYGSDDDVQFSYTADYLSGSNMQKNSFAKINGNGEAQFDDEMSVFQSTTEQIKKIGVIFEYNFDVIEYIYYKLLGNALLDNVISATCDWSLMI